MARSCTRVDAILRVTRLIGAIQWRRFPTTFLTAIDMTELSYLPNLPHALGPLLPLAALIIAAVVIAHLLREWLGLPRITGYFLCGFVAGPGVLNLVDASWLADARIAFDFTLALILFELGRRLDLRWMRNDHWLPLTAFTESLGAFLLVYLLLMWFGVSSLYAAVAGGVAIATSPAVVMAVVRDEKAEGPLTERVLAIAAFDNVIAVLVVTALIGVLHMQRDITWLTAITHPLYLVIGSVLAGGIAYFIASRLARLLGKRDELQFALLIALLLIIAEATRIFQLSVLIAALTFGVAARNLDRGGKVSLLDVGHGFTLVLVVLFLSAGGAITPKAILAAGGLALVLIVARAVGKAIPALLFAPLSGLSVRKSVMLGAALTPMSAVAIALVESVSRAHPDFAESGAAVLLAAVALLELIGPLVTQAALRWAGEAEPTAARR